MTSISGDQDGLATPADIADAKPKLPVRTKYVVIKGGIHAFFGDYGDQPGRRHPGVDRQVAQTADRREHHGAAGVATAAAAESAEL